MALGTGPLESTQGERVKVLYVAGWMRSGSTLLDTLLGELDGFVSTGEMASFWSRGLVKGRQCGCGRRVLECPLWSRVIEILYGQESGFLEEAEKTARVQERVVRLRNLGRLLVSKGGPAVGWEPLREYVEAADRLYRSLAQVTGARVIVNSSKLPQEAAVLPLIPSIEPYLVHIVRDPRAVVHSMSRKMMLQASPSDQVRMPRSSAGSSASGWLRVNLGMEMVRTRYRHLPMKLIRYEDLAERPAETLSSLAEFVGEAGSGLTMVDDHTVRLHGNHTVWGNPARFRRGLVRIRHDDEWKRSLSCSKRTLASLIAAPLLPRYGYSLRPRA